MRDSAKGRTRVLGQLGLVERVLTRAWRVFLWGALLGVLALILAAIVLYPGRGEARSEYFYLGVALLVALGWISGKLRELRLRDRRADHRARTGAPAGIAHSEHSGPADLEDGTAFLKWQEVRFGTGPGAEAEGAAPTDELQFKRGFSLKRPLASLPAHVAPDDGTLDAIAAALAGGEELAEACEANQPAYRHWNALERRAYRFLVESRLEERGRHGGGTDG